VVLKVIGAEGIALAIDQALAEPEVSRLMEGSARSNPPAQMLVNYSGSWRITDSVSEGAGAGQVFSFDVVLLQSGDRVFGGNAELSLEGTVNGDTLMVRFNQPHLGYSGQFTWVMTNSSRGVGSFRSSAPNSGQSTIVRLP
jgi:hypothetical protein